MNDVLLVISMIITVVIVATIIWLIFEHKKLKKKFGLLNSCVERNNKDLAGLCAAAVIVDKRLSESGNQLNDTVEKRTVPEPQEQPYRNAIQLILEGANTEDLMQQIALSRDEADLLIRLHGNN